MPSGACVVEYRGKRGTVWRVKYADADGRQVMETVGAERDGVTRKQAEAELRERLVRVERRGYRRPKPITFAEYARAWFEEGETRRRWRSSTVLQYRSIRRRLVDHFGVMPLAAIRPRHVAEYVAEQSGDLGAATVSRDVSILHAIFSSARREELVDGNPAERAERPKAPARQWRILEAGEVSRLAAAFSDAQARAVFLTLILTGLRRSELQRLSWGDVDLLAGVLRVRESKSDEGVRSIAVPPTLARELADQYARTAYKGDGELVFCHPERGTVYTARTFKAALEAAMTVAGVEGTLRPFHDLRHSSITADAASGASAIAVMAKAGHRNMATTRTYLHLAGTVFREEADRLEARLLGQVSTEPSTDLA